MTKSAPLRIALREEGEWWNAYVAEPTTMERATKIASIRMGIVQRSDEHKQAFIALMRNIIEDILAEKGVEVDYWKEPETAPESERGGHA